MAFTNEVPWHGLGSKLEEGAPLETWRKAAGLDWEAEAAQLHYELPEAMVEYTDRYTLIRMDTKAPLTNGVVGKGYKIVQPDQVLKFFGELAQDYGAFKLETAGSLFGGRKIWALARAASDMILFDNASDAVIRYLLMATSFDSTIPTIVQQTAVRVVCNNTLTAAVGSKHGEAQIRLSHKTTFSADKIRQKMMLDEQWTMFSQSLRNLSRKVVTEDQARVFFFNVYFPPAVRQLETFSQKSADRRIAELMSIYRTAPGQQLETARDTAWGLLNAVTYHVDHTARSKTQDLRLDKAWFGTGNQLKSAALQEAQNLVLAN